MTVKELKELLKGIDENKNLVIRNKYTGDYMVIIDNVYENDKDEVEIESQFM